MGYKVINLEQGTDAWLDMRRSHVTATDVSVICGSNPFKTPAELWREKMGLAPPQESNAAMERGSRLEPEARAMACKVLKFDFEPVVIVSDEHPWAMASLDGISGARNIILEIKCPKEATHLDTFHGNGYPRYYYDQMQWQMLVSGAGECYYFSYRPECPQCPFAFVSVIPDKEWQKFMLVKGYEFYQRLCNFDEPEEWKINIR